MKKLIPILIVFLNIIACEEKPVRDYYGFSADEKNVLIAGLMNNTTYSSTSYGTVLDSSLNVEFKRCTQGQIYNSTSNNCTNINNEPDKLTFCNVANNFCNTTAIPFTLTDPGSLTISEAYNSCKNDTTGNYSNWRVANLVELAKLAAGGRNSMFIWFPGTLEENYWSANGNENDTSGLTAKAVSFSRSEFGNINLISKDTRLYVRCVRNLK